jgi:hypothetical protein
MVAQRWCRYSATCDHQKVRVAVRRNVAALACAAALLVPTAAWQQDLAKLARSEFGWPEVARGVTQAARGRLSGLPLVPAS